MTFGLGQHGRELWMREWMLDEARSSETGVTIYDVAEASGVSISTVSNAINRPERVGNSTRLRVIEVAHQLGYVPKAEAASLARRLTRRVGVFAPFSSYESFMRRLAGVLEVAAEAGIEVSVFDHASAARLQSPVLESIPLKARFDGIIAMGLAIDPEVERRLQERDVPVVIVDANSDRFPSVVIDDSGLGSMAAEHLIGLGHRRFGYVSEAQASDYESQSTRRLRGFRSVLDEHGGCELDVVEALPTVEQAAEAGLDLLRRVRRPTAIVAHFDLMAAGVLRAAAMRSLRVPDDLSVMGFDDGQLAIATDLSTVHQPFEESGRAAMQMLVAAIKVPARRTLTRLPVELTSRGTTARPAPESKVLY